MSSQNLRVSKALLNILLLPLVFFSQVTYVNGTAISGNPVINGDDSIEVGAGVIAVRTTLTSDQSGALKAQNDGRELKNMTLLIWDDTLTQHAQIWANHLASINTLAHSSSDQRPGEGENLAWAWATYGVKSPMTQGAQEWMAEANDYHGELIPQGNFEAYGHYTQCMWNTTTRVGIALATAANGGVYTVARYSPPGNYVGLRPY